MRCFGALVFITATELKLVCMHRYTWVYVEVRRLIAGAGPFPYVVPWRWPQAAMSDAMGLLSNSPSQPCSVRFLRSWCSLHTPVSCCFWCINHFRDVYVCVWTSLLCLDLSALLLILCGLLGLNVSVYLVHLLGSLFSYLSILLWECEVSQTANNRTICF